jgi:putative oxidoreductase
MGLRPGERWACLAGLSEACGGSLTALGFMHPVGPLTTLAPMAVAAGRAHAGKPIWVTQGGAELPMTNMAVAVALAMVGPGRYSLDRLLGLRLGPLMTAFVAAAVAGGTATVFMQPQPEPEAAEQPAQQPRAATTSDTRQSEAATTR